MPTKYYTVMLNTGAPPPVAALKVVFGEAKSWAKFHANAWVIATDLTADDWYQRIRAVLPPDDHVLVLRADRGDYKGWVASVMADWMQQDHSAKEGL